MVEEHQPENCNYYDLVILGASGFTGKYVVKEALKFLNTTSPISPLKTIALAGPLPSKGPLIEHQKKVELWELKLPLSDSMVDIRTLSTLAENPHGLPGVNESDEHIEKRKNFWLTMKPSHIRVMFGSKSFLDFLRFISVGMIISLFGRLGFGRWLLLKFPSVLTLGCFRKEGPSEEEVESATFKMWFVGQSYSRENLAASHKESRKPDIEIVTRVMGPEVGYLTTPVINSSSMCPYCTEST
ncbi:hypothetical protein MKW94_003065 [Papaver nudicaule]|uniref:Uncharacterized protein n=1 Tax=Papaver nudicaule TaxID=74823 RepID=A0AA42B061_PAPNU|nr:hypothetical protein [Papaver nudicaule]